MQKLPFLLLLILCLSACKHDHKHGDKHGHKHNHDHAKEAEGQHANHHMHQTSFEDLVKNFESPERASYQKPAAVIDFLGDLTGKTVMDLGAGTGYFSFPLVDAGAKVIAADVDDQFLNYIRDKKAKLKITDQQLEIRKVPFDGPELQSKEVDLILIVNTYHHIENRLDYFKKAKFGLKKGGKLVIIDFKKKDLPIGPPLEMKISGDLVKKELKRSGFSNVNINNSLLEYQYIVSTFK